MLVSEKCIPRLKRDLDACSMVMDLRPSLSGLGLVGGARVTARPGVRVGVGVGAICYVTLNVIVVCDMVSFPTWSVVSF